MARCPFATWHPLPANSKQARMVPRLAIVHTAVDAPGPSDLYNWFLQSGLESHFFVHNDGSITQYMDTDVVAEANYKANGFAVSIETEDDGRPEQNPWNPAQHAALVRLLDWLCSVHPIPRRKADRWDGSGVGWHSMWGLNTRTQPTVNPWTTALGKTCPGTPRIVQLRDQIIPRLAAGPSQEDNDMYTDDDRRMAQSMAHRVEALAKALNTATGGPDAGESIPFVTMLEAAAWRLHRALQLNPGLPSGVPAVDNGEALPLIELLQQLAADVAELKARPVADVDEAALAAELEARGWDGVTVDEVKEVIRAAFARAGQPEGSTT